MADTDEWEGPRRLPTLRFEDGEYFIDNRLDEFRTVTPPVRRIEFIRFESEKGLRMLKACVWRECTRCGRLVAVARRATKSATWCCDCGGRVPVREDHQPDKAVR